MSFGQNLDEEKETLDKLVDLIESYDYERVAA